MNAKLRTRSEKNLNCEKESDFSSNELLPLNANILWLWLWLCRELRERERNAELHSITLHSKQDVQNERGKENNKAKKTRRIKHSRVFDAKKFSEINFVPAHAYFPKKIDETT